MNINLLRLTGALTLAVPAFAPAQDADAARMPVPELRYESAFAGYTPYEALAPADWRAVNDALGQAAQKPAGPAKAADGALPAPAIAKPPAPSSPDGHRAHGAHGGMR